MSIDLPRLAAQGRAYSTARAWTPAEWEAVVLIQTERNISRILAADFVRNGILTLEDYDRATEAEFVPKTLGAAVADTEASLKDHEFATDTEKLAKEAAKAQEKAKKDAEKAAKKAAADAAKAAKKTAADAAKAAKKAAKGATK